MHKVETEVQQDMKRIRYKCVEAIVQSVLLSVVAAPVRRRPA